MTDNSQAAQILRALQSGKTLTPMEALLKYGCYRLGARVWDLRQQGHPIENVWAETPDGKRFAKYRLKRKAA